MVKYPEGMLNRFVLRRDIPMHMELGGVYVKDQSVFDSEVKANAYFSWMFHARPSNRGYSLPSFPPVALP